MTSERQTDRHRDGWALVTAAQDGNVDAFGELWKRYQPEVQRFISGKVRDQAAAEDLTSETFLRAWQALGSARDQGRDIGAWLITIARHKVIDETRAVARSPVRVPRTPVTSEDSSVAGAVPGPETTVPEQLDRAGVSVQLGRYLAQLAIREQECLRLRYAQELPGEQISQALRCSASGARTLQYRALKRLGGLLADDGHASSASFLAACDEPLTGARDALAYRRRLGAQPAARACIEGDRSARTAWTASSQLPAREVA
jgi:RNA polymerase sigma-70 factor (ECF subfamily)